MTDWQKIETADTDSMAYVILWSGQLVTVGWRDETFWQEGLNTNGMTDDPIIPPPTHWMPLPKPPES